MGRTDSPVIKRVNALAQDLHDTVDGEDCLHDPIESVERRILLHGGVSLDADKNSRKNNRRNDQIAERFTRCDYLWEVN